jgi:lipoprotein-releasing system permease protein
LNNALYIAKRYIFSKTNKNAVNIISGFAVLAVIVGAMSLFIVLSGFAGLKKFALKYTTVFDSDMRIGPAQGKTVTITPEQFKKLQAIDGITAVSQVIEERVFLQYKGKNHIAYIKGVDNNYPNITSIDSILFTGDWFLNNQDQVVVGFGIANKMSLFPGDNKNSLDIYVPKPGKGQTNILDPTSAFTKIKTVASGIYEINEELNSKYVFAEIALARDLLNLPSNKVTFIEFKLPPTAVEKDIAAKISEVFPKQSLIIKNRAQQNDALYKMLNSENLFVYFFVSLIAAIAIFNLAGTLIMVILEKRSNIKTLYFLGYTIKEIRRIFYYNGLLMTLIGVVIGLFLAASLILLQLAFGFVPITATLPYPVEFKLSNLLLVFVTITGLGALASKVASLRVTEKLLS